jgi:methyl-accepting chemotaxis protein
VADEMRESSQGVSEGREDVDTIAHSLEHIRSAVSEAATRAEEIFHGTDTQFRDFEAMVARMDEVARAAARNAGSIDGVVATCEQQVVSTRALVGASSTLAGLASELRGGLRRFNTGAVAAAERES